MMRSNKQTRRYIRNRRWLPNPKKMEFRAHNINQAKDLNMEPNQL